MMKSIYKAMTKASNQKGMRSASERAKKIREIRDIVRGKRETREGV